MALVETSTVRMQTRRIVLGMALGVVVGYVCHIAAADAAATKITAGYFSIVTDIFFRMIKMVIAPLVFSTLVSGIANMDDTKSIGRIGLKTLSWFVVASLVSLSIGLLFVNLLHPGAAMNLPLPNPIASLDTGAFNLGEFVTHLFPKSIFEAMAGNEIIQILIFSLFFGVALGKMTSASGSLVKEAINGLQDLMLRVTGAVMSLAPLGVFCAVAAVITVHGLAVLVTYGRFIGSFYLALACLWTVLFFAGYLVLKSRMLSLAKLVRTPMIIAFSTASSEAAYPAMLESLQRFGLKRHLVGFVLPLGYSFNLDGSMVYQAFAAIFIAQAFHVQMSLGLQITMLLVLLISSKGIAAVPRGSLVVVASVLHMFGLPEAGLALIIGADQFLDMGRTATNVLGNSIAAAVVAKWENELGPQSAVLEEEAAAVPDPTHRSARSSRPLAGTASTV
jgi:Na+/H+-dicarboxylate symporter